MTFKQWLNKALSEDLICDQYRDRIENAQSKKQFMDIVLEGNGLHFLCQMMADGHGLPYDVMEREFAPFINGEYVATIAKKSGSSYDSALFVRLNDKSEIRAVTTATGLFGCSCRVVIPNYSFVQLYVDSGCDIVVECPMSSKCYIDYWDGAKIEVEGNIDGVLFENVK